MSTADLGRFSAESTTASRDKAESLGLRSLFLPFASLWFTVILFALSIVLVLAGTLAQVDHDIWYVVHNYFRTWIAWIDFQVFFPRSLGIPGGIWFPGGWLLGTALGINLLAAHTLRFKVAAKGSDLLIGSALIAAGVGITWLVIRSGLDDTVESELTPEFCNGLWHALRFALGAATLGFAYYLALTYQRVTQTGASWLWWLEATFCSILIVLSAWLFTHPEAQLDPSGLRILWQLIKSTGAGVVLLVGCSKVFGRRGGIVLLHGGIALMMFSELWTGLHQQESQMRLVEGQTLNYAEDIRSVELAVTDKSDSKDDRVTAVPLQLLVDTFDAKKVFVDEALPFALRVVEHYPNATARFVQPGEKNPATRGVGVLQIAEDLPINTGVGMEQGVDAPALYIELLDKADHEKSLGVYLLSPFLDAEPLLIEDQPVELALRFERIYKPYSVELVKFNHDLYVGSSKAKNFSSEVRLLEPEQNVDRRFKIWMNNPLRYGGDTLYQSGFDPNNSRATTLQVMTNSGWLIPYVSCMLVAIGMFAQFGSTFLRFTRRQEGAQPEEVDTAVPSGLSNWRSPNVWIPALIVILAAVGILSRMRTPKAPATAMQIAEFGKLPVAYSGRIKPFDTLARNTLTVLSDRASLEGKPATYWILELITNTPASNDARILRIENLDVLQDLNLKPREGFRYSLNELRTSGDEYMQQYRLAVEVPEQQRTLVQKKFLDLARKIILVNTLQDAFSPPAVRTGSLEELRADFEVVSRKIEQLNDIAPRAVPPEEVGKPWQTMLEAERDAIFAKVRQQEVNEATIALRGLLDAYAEGDVQSFNEGLSAYGEIVKERAEADEQFEADLVAGGESDDRKTAEKLRLGRVEFEAFFNHFNPFSNAMALYLAAFALAACSWLGWNTTLNRAANWLLLFTFALHTYALVCRVYISGRPPVTNLYSSAVFIGWAAVLFALVFERVYRFGIGNLLASVIGFPTLFIAYNLAGDGDTFEVLQAVLDTQFWLATHVVCITLGYSTTLLAGVLGVFYLLMAHVGGGLTEQQRQHLTRMTYGTLCFATFFSFVGTVLGGLWADDSWGRFWGWDPKENGALMIVIWNALVLHARWGAMVRQRGMAVLAVFGNIVTAWSWFGVNQMGEGLHAYGFRKGMTFWLCVFAVSQLAIMVLGCLPFGSNRDDGDKQAATQQA